MAPAWHTGILICVFVAAALAPGGKASSATLTAALTLGVTELLILGYVLAGTRGWRPSFRLQWEDVLLGLGCGVLFTGVSYLLSGAHPAFTGVPGAALWLPVLALVAVTEELTFRGYLQRQLEAAGGLPFPLAALGQALLFGLVHLSQGGLVGARFAVFGLLLAFLTRARGSLSAAVLAHLLYDAAALFS